MSLAPVRFGVVGVGGFGLWHALTLRGLAEAELVGLVDTSDASLKRAAEAFPGVRVCGVLEDALRDTDTEAWVIATRTDSHVPIAETLLRAGKRVLVEKPLAPDVASAERLEPLVAADSSNLMAGHVVLFAPLFRRLLDEVHARGPLKYFHLARHRPVDHNTRYPEETPLRLTMVHDLYMALALTRGGEPTRFWARLHRRSDGGSDLAVAQLEWPSGAWGQFTASFLTPMSQATGTDRIELFGDNWSAALELNPQPLVIHDADRTAWPVGIDMVPDPQAPTGWLAEELRCFCRVVRGVEAVPVGARYEDALRVQRWMDALEASAKET
jgi:predicted dehydrogenase